MPGADKDVVDRLPPPPPRPRDRDRDVFGVRVALVVATAAAAPVRWVARTAEHRNAAAIAAAAPIPANDPPPNPVQPPLPVPVALLSPASMLCLTSTSSRRRCASRPTRARCRGGVGGTEGQEQKVRNTQYRGAGTRPGEGPSSRETDKRARALLGYLRQQAHEGQVQGV